MARKYDFAERAKSSATHRVTRRHFIRAITCSGGGILLGGISCRNRKVRLVDVPATKWVAPPEARAFRTEASFRSPREVRTELRVGYAKLKMANDQGGEDSLYLRSYNGAITGPVIRVKPGDKLVVNLINELPEEPDPPFGAHGINITNLHSHGLHVSPEEGDNIFLEIGPGGRDGTTRTLIYNIPENHHPGTFWYHPHKHGSVAIQVASGMAGALIVEGDIDQVPEIAAAQERIFIFQQIPYSIEGKIGWDEAHGSGLPDKRYTTINGQLKPSFEMNPGEVQRWRFIHAGIKEKLTIALEEHQLSIIAHDGITTGRREDLPTEKGLEMYPGYREDILVKANKKPGKYILYDRRDDNGLFNPETDQQLAEVIVTGEEKDMSLPDPSQLQPLAHLGDLRYASLYRERLRVEFDIAANKFTICNKEFAMSDPPLEMKLNGIDEWDLITDKGVPRHHPFHTHVNPFQIIKNGDIEYPHPVWRDTIIVEKNKPLIIRTHCKDFVGESVLHCHILDHEDLGMMTKIKIVEGEPKQYSCL